MKEEVFSWESFIKSMARGLRWAAILKFRPDLAERCDWSSFDATSWRFFLERQPDFADRCAWSKLDGADWALILRRHPQFSVNCHWARLDGDDWSSLLECHPEFADKCDQKKLGLTALVLIALEQPQLAEKFNLSSLDWSRLDLAALQPEAFLSSEEEGLLWSLFGDGFGGEFGYLTDFVERFPQYAEKCDWEKLANSAMECPCKTELPESAKCGNS